MKRIFYCIAMALATPPIVANAQDLPVIAEDQSIEANQTEAEVQTAEKKAEMKASEDLIAFFTGLEQAVDSAQGDCQKISDVMRDYYESHKGWISGLDYSTTNVNSQTIDTLHLKAIEFGKKLSACYDQESIPEQLHRYAGLGEEW